MCIRETRHWSCPCRPAVFYHSCPQNKLKDIELCPDYQIHQSFPKIQCNDCYLTAWPTPPSSPSRSIRELKSVFESQVKKDAKQDAEGARGTRHRRDSVGKLEDKCMECRTWGLPCDMKQPHCTSCLRNGTVCETTKEWFGRVSGRTASRNSPRPNQVDIMPPAPISHQKPGRTRARSTSINGLEVQAFLKSGVTTSHPPEQDYSACHRATDEGLADLKKNLRGLSAIMAMHGGSRRDPEEMGFSVSEPGSKVHDFSRLPTFMNFPPEEKAEAVWVEPRFEHPEATIVDEVAADENISPTTTFIKLDEPSPFSPEQESVLSSGESDIFSPSSESFGDEGPSETPSLEPDARLQSPNPGNDAEFRSSLNGLNATSGKVRTAAQHAYRKLKTVARSKKASVAFRRFVGSLGSLDNILRIGSQTFEMLVDQETPNSLIQIYCFLHFAYAMSQGDTDLLPRSDEREYQRGLLVFRSCLPSIPEDGGLHSQRDIFDEIAHHMARELECALRWAKKQNLTPTSFQGLSLEDVLRLHSERGDSFKPIVNVETLGGLQAANGMEVATQSPNQTATCGTTSWRDIRSLTVFDGVAGFLTGLSRFGSPFKLFSGEFCKSISSGMYKHPVYSKGFRQRYKLLVADELRDGIQNEIVSKFDHRLIAHGSLLQVLETSLEMFDLGSLITLEDFVEYARGLVIAAVLPIYLAQAFENEIVRRSQELMRKLPAYLLGRIQWPECFSAPTMIPAASSNEPHYPNPQMDTSYSVANVDFVVNMAQSVPQPDVPMLDTFYPADSVSQTYLQPEPQMSFSPSIQSYSPTDAMDFEPCSTPGSSQPANYSPQPSLVSTPPPLSAASCSSEDIESPKSPNPTPTPTSITFICSKCRKTFTNKSNLSRHERTKHNTSGASCKKVLRCPVAGCKTMLGSARAKENMRTHLKKKHGIERPGIEEVRWRVDVLGRC
ncbi:hypothetical protein TWF696_004578 [Orbilia brochopaga]|uniref:C2H2-type domain-containing protein n=1 Tax=Orbilia brochopaga TaxID=3140254 RepID=A0AAV9V6I8_9PEZI